MTSVGSKVADEFATFGLENNEGSVISGVSEARKHLEKKQKLRALEGDFVPLSKSSPTQPASLPLLDAISKSHVDQPEKHKLAQYRNSKNAQAGLTNNKKRKIEEGTAYAEKFSAKIKGKQNRKSRLNALKMY